MSIVSNTTPLSELAKIGRLPLLRDLYGEVIIPEEVYVEVTAGSHPAVTEVPATDWITVRSVTKQGAVAALCARTGLGAGECAAILLAEELGAAEVLIDDRAARLVAEARGLDVTGTVASLLLAKRVGLLPAIRDPLDELIRHGTRIGPWLYREALDLAGE